MGRVIARPFVGQYPDYKRTSNRHDFSLMPPRDTMLDHLRRAGKETIGVGKIYDIFAGKGISRFTRTKDNADGMEQAIALAGEDFEGLCFVNLVDFDMVYGHRNNVDGYAAAATAFDRDLARLMGKLREGDVVILTADHGCDPSTPSTDHSREYTPMVIFGDRIKAGVNLGTRPTFADIAATVLDYLGAQGETDGTSFLPQVLR